MKLLAGLFAAEQQKIESALRRICDRLPWPVRDVARYSLLDGGKRLRPYLCLNILRMFDCKQDQAYELACTLEMIHVSSLLHDDILDEATSRRGKPSAHTVYGIATCLLAGDAILAEASRITAGFGQPDLVDCLAQTILNVVNGEVLEIAMQGDLDQGLDSYLEIIGGKTAWLFQSACRLPGLFARQDQATLEALSGYGYNLGLAFQIVDDALDFADEAETGKPTGGDLREAKATPPILLYAASLNPALREVFKSRFATRDFSPEEVLEISAEIRARGFDAQAREQAVSYLDKAEACLRGLPPGKHVEVLRQALIMVKERKS